MIDDGFQADGAKAVAAKLRRLIESVAREAAKDGFSGVQTELEKVMKQVGLINRKAFADWLAPELAVGLLSGFWDVQQESGPQLVANAPSDIEGGFFIRPKEAIDFFRSKRVVTYPEFQDLEAAARARAFSMARLTDDYTLQIVNESVARAVENGEQVFDWLNRLESVLNAAGIGEDIALGLWHWRLVYTQNTSLAYSAGRYTQMMRSTDTRPWWLYIAIHDENTRPEHMALDGMIRRYDDPIWRKYYPPWDFGCRCTVVSVSPEEMQADGLHETSDAEILHSYEQAAQRPISGMPLPRPGFGYDPREAFFLNKGPGGLEPTTEGAAAFRRFAQQYDDTRAAARRN